MKVFQSKHMGDLIQGSFVGSFPEQALHEDAVPEAGSPDERILHSVALSLVQNLTSVQGLWAQGPCVQGSFVGSFPEWAMHEDVVPEGRVPDKGILHCSSGL